MHPRLASLSLLLVGSTILGACERNAEGRPADDPDRVAAAAAADTAARLIAEGQRVFRHETFGNEIFWTDTLKLFEAIERNLDPTTALSVGLKVDADAVPAGFLQAANLKSVATTIQLLKQNAIVGLRAAVNTNNIITGVGITCALCHSTVDNSVGPGIGHRIDGPPNRELNVGAIIALSAALKASQQVDYESWGPGRYDPRYNFDGISDAVMIPPVYGMRNVNNATYTADGTVSYWNSYVAVTQMHGQGNFTDQALGVNVQQSPDLVTPKLVALLAYQRSLPVPTPPVGSYDGESAERGRVVFVASCGSCHTGGGGTDNNSGRLHPPEATGMDGRYAARSTTKQYRATPLRGLWQHAPYFHDGSAATLDEVVRHYDRHLKLQLTPSQRTDLVEYLKTL
jgi:mono/diheme cytochrome c family protein